LLADTLVGAFEAALPDTLADAFAASLLARRARQAG
jgi:hypothetical protein